MENTMFTQEQMKNLDACAKEIMASVQGKKSAKEIMVEIYVHVMKNKTIPQGELIADSILKGIKAFDRDYEAAKEDVDKFVNTVQDKLDEGKSCVERCNYWMKFGTAISGTTLLMNGETEKQEDLLEKIQNMFVSEEEATPEMAEKLRQQAMEAIKNSGLLFKSLLEQEKVLETLDDGDEAAKLIIDMGDKEFEYRGILAMLTYTQVKSGKFENIPSELTAEQVATLTCTAVEEIRIMEAVNKGSLAIDAAAGLLYVLGVVAALAITAAVIGPLVCLLKATLGALLAVPAVIMLAFGVMRGLSKVGELWKEDSRIAVEEVAGGIKTVISGVKRVANFVATKLMPGILEKAHDAFSWVMNKVHEFVPGN